MISYDTWQLETIHQAGRRRSSSAEPTETVTVVT